MSDPLPSDAVVVQLRLPFDTDASVDEPGYHVWIIEQGQPYRLRGSYPKAQATELARTLNGILRCPVAIDHVVGRRGRRWSSKAAA